MARRKKSEHNADKFITTNGEGEFSSSHESMADAVDSAKDYLANDLDGEDSRTEFYFVYKLVKVIKGQRTTAYTESSK